jgi:hypothetical protein
VLSESLFGSDGFAWVVAREGISSGTYLGGEVSEKGRGRFGDKWWVVDVISMLVTSIG